MARHTTMPVRIQRTPFGDVKLTSRWMRDRYYLVAAGPDAALRWLFPNKAVKLEQISPVTFRMAFAPAPNPITVERELRRICSAWQGKWEERFQDHQEGITTPGDPTLTIKTLGDLFDHLYQERLGQVAVSTSSRDRYRLQLWREEIGNHLPLVDLTPDKITAALQRIGKRISASTANPALGVLKTYLNWAHNMGLMPAAVHRTVKRLKEPSSSRRTREWWAGEEVELALQCAALDHHQPTATLLVAVGCYLGLRPEEIIMLRWQDLSLDAVDPQTGKSKPVCHVVAHDGWKPKDGEDRDVPISDPLLVILKQHRQKEGYLLEAEPGRPGRRRGGKGWVYRYDPKKVWLRIMRRIEAAGGRSITMYGMRHSFASNLLIAGVSDVKVSRWLGHSDTRMLHRHYGHLLSYDDDINAFNFPERGAKEVDREYRAGA